MHTMSKWYLLLDGLNVQVVQLTKQFVEDYPFCLAGPFNSRDEARQMVPIADQAQAAGWLEGYKAALRKVEARRMAS